MKTQYKFPNLGLGLIPECLLDKLYSMYEPFQKRQESIVLDEIRKTRSAFAPCDVMLDDRGFVMLPECEIKCCGRNAIGIFESNSRFIRYDFAEAFLGFPRALPTELKGIAV